MNRETLLRNFSLNLPVAYHKESMLRLTAMKPSHLRKAAVMIGCVERDNGLKVILTKRAHHLRHHPGQIGFPGGKYEEYDSSLIATALREVDEEIGVKAEQIHVIGSLPELMTISRFLVTPILALVDSDYQAKIDPNEVDSIFEVPAEHLFDIEKLSSQLFHSNQNKHRIFAIPYKQHFIWGMTAQIIQALQLQLKAN